MGMQQRPGRPTTRVGPSVPAPAAKPAQPAGRSTRVVRPGTGSVPKQSAPPPAPSRGRASGSSTRSVAKQSSSRPVPKQAAKSNTPMIIAGVAGVVVLLGIAAFAMSGDSKKPETPAAKPASKPKVVDVAGLEREGMSKCDQGLSIIKKCESAMSSSSLGEGEKSRLKADLEQATNLLKDGMAMLDEANRKSGNTYSISPYIEAKKVARMKLGELGGK
jgi:hypothetical protein